MNEDRVSGYVMLAPIVGIGLVDIEERKKDSEG
jgi:hypothetical protein